MKCDKFQPGCASDAACMVRGCRLCVPCAQAFVGYTPDPIEEARQYLERMSNFPGRNDSLDHLALVADLADALRADLTAAQARAERLEHALVQCTDDDAMINIVQGALVDLGVRTRLDTGESMRDFCNSIAGEIIDMLRQRFIVARAAVETHGG